MVALSRDLISLLISFSVMLTAALAVLPQRIAQSPLSPHSITSRSRHHLASAWTGERAPLYNQSGGHPTAAGHSEGRAWQSVGQQIGPLQRPPSPGRDLAEPGRCAAGSSSNAPRRLAVGRRTSHCGASAPEPRVSSAIAFADLIGEKGSDMMRRTFRGVSPDQ